MHFNNPTYNRCIAAKQYQNAANIRGCSVATIIAEQESLSKSSETVRQLVTQEDREKPFTKWRFEALDALKSHNVSQAAVARKMGVADRTMSMTLKGYQEASPAWRKTFDMALASIVGGE